MEPYCYQRTSRTRNGGSGDQHVRKGYRLELKRFRQHFREHQAARDGERPGHRSYEHQREGRFSRVSDLDCLQLGDLPQCTPLSRPPVHLLTSHDPECHLVLDGSILDPRRPSRARPLVPGHHCPQSWSSSAACRKDHRSPLIREQVPRVKIRVRNGADSV